MTLPLLGEVGEVTLVEVVQLINLTRKAGVLNVDSERGRGSLYFVAGEVVHAQDPEGEGTEAVARILACSSGRFEFEQKPFVSPRTGSGDTLSIIMRVPQEAEAPAETPAETPPAKQRAGGLRDTRAFLASGAERRSAMRVRPEQRAHPVLRLSLDQIDRAIAKLERL